MLSIIDRILLNDNVTSEDIESLTIQKPIAYKLIYSYIPFDKYHTNIEIEDINLDDFKNSPNFQESILFQRKSKTLNKDELRDFIETYPFSKWFTSERRDMLLFDRCNVIKSPLSHYMKEIYELNILHQFPLCWKLLIRQAPINGPKCQILNLEPMTWYELDCIAMFKFIYKYDQYIYKLNDKRSTYKNILAYIIHEIITLCDYSDNLTHYKKSILIKYYAVLNDSKNSLPIRIEEFNIRRNIHSFTDILICLNNDKQYRHIEALMLENLELCYELSLTFRSYIIMGIFHNIMNYSSKEFKDTMMFIFHNYFSKLVMKSKKLIYYISFSLDSECILCCKITDIILKCVSCEKAICCTICVNKLVNRKKCILCQSALDV